MKRKGEIQLDEEEGPLKPAIERAQARRPSSVSEEREKGGKKLLKKGKNISRLKC